MPVALATKAIWFILLPIRLNCFSVYNNSTDGQGFGTTFLYSILVYCDLLKFDKQAHASMWFNSSSVTLTKNRFVNFCFIFAPF